MSDHPVLVTGAAGFIGFGLARRLLEGGRAVVGVDSVNSYYDPALKEARLAILRRSKNFTFHRLDLAERKPTEALFHGRDFGPVVHLAAQAGVRHSLENPHAYVDANLAGFLNVLDGCRHRRLALGLHGRIVGNHRGDRIETRKVDRRRKPKPGQHGRLSVGDVLR